MPVSIDPDQQKNEETTKLRYITPVIWERWQDVDKVLMEYYFTDGRISVDEYNMAHRGKPKKADYLLLYRDNIPLAIVEAKAIDHSADEGYSQAVEYANSQSAACPAAYPRYTRSHRWPSKEPCLYTNARAKRGR